jgi:signal transduction histidine kinase
LAHFLRNRFMVIGGFSRRLLKKTDNKEIKGYAETIAREIEEMERSLQVLEEMLQGEEEELQRAREVGI